MTTIPDFRALAQELFHQLSAYDECNDVVEVSQHWNYTDCNELLDRARAELATPPPQPLRPIPVSERLPEAGDCDPDGSCWVHQPNESWPESPEWKLMRNKYVSTIYRSTHWLPYNAIPLPQVTQ